MTADASISPPYTLILVIYKLATPPEFACDVITPIQHESLHLAAHKSPRVFLICFRGTRRKSKLLSVGDSQKVLTTSCEKCDVDSAPAANMLSLLVGRRNPNAILRERVEVQDIVRNIVRASSRARRSTRTGTSTRARGISNIDWFFGKGFYKQCKIRFL